MNDEGFDVLDVGYQEAREPTVSRSGGLVESDFQEGRLGTFQARRR
jgi:hypothetical protein